MKVALPGILAGVGGIGAVATTVGVVYHRPEVEDSRENNNNENNDAKFEELKKEIKRFSEKCPDTSKEYGTTVLKELEGIFKMLLEKKNNGIGTSSLDVRRGLLEKRLGENERKSFKDLYRRLEEFSKSLKNNQEKFYRYKEKLGQK